MQCNLKQTSGFQVQKQLPRGVLSKGYSENMQQIYRRTPIPKCDFNKVAFSNFIEINTSGWVFYYKFAACFQNIFF